MPNEFKVRIESGILRTKSINILSNETTRSTKARVSDSFLNTLQNELKNCVFAELFGGSGFMAISAISRGARLAHAFEKDKNSFEVLRKNIKSLELESKLIAHFGDTFALAVNELKNEQNLIIYLDPPFNIRAGFDEIYENCLDLAKNINPQIAVFEHNSEISLPQSLGDLELKRVKKFGKTTLSYFFSQKC